MVTRQWSEVTRPSADCQTTFFVRFKQFEIFLKKVTEWSRDSGRRSRDRRPTVKQRYLYVSSNLKNFWKKSLNGHATVAGGHATVVWLLNNIFWRFKRFGKFLKKVTEGHATVVGGHATVGWLSNNVFGRFKQLGKFLKKSHWMVTRQWSEVTRTSADCQTTFLDVSSNLKFFWKKVTERSRDSGRRSRDRRPTVKQRFLDVSSNLKFFWKKSLNGHATVVGGHATVGRLSNNAFGRLKQFENFLKKVTERSRDSGRRSRDRRLTVKHIYAWIKERERERERLSPLHFIRAPPCCAVGRFISRRPGWG